MPSEPVDAFMVWWRDERILRQPTKLDRAIWLGALAAAERKMPSATYGTRGENFLQDRSWNRCLSEVSERLASLKAGAP